MPTTKYPLESDGPDRLEIRWEGGFFYPDRNIRVLLDGAQIGSFADRAQLRAGQEYQLPDQSRLHVGLVDGSLRVSIDGLPLDKLEHPKRIVRSSAQAFIFYGVVSLALGGLVLSRLLFPDSSQITLWTLLIAGGAYVVIGLLAYRRSSLAFLFGAVLYVVEAAILAWQESHLSVTALYGVLHTIYVAFESIRAVRRTAVNQ